MADSVIRSEKGFRPIDHDGSATGTGQTPSQGATLSSSPSTTSDLASANEEWPRDCLLVLLRARLVLGWAEKYPIRRLSLGATSFEPVSDPTLCFYDWLRNAEGNLLGVRCYPDGESLSSAARLEYCKRKGATSEKSWELEIFFSEEREIKPEFSVDQDFMYNELFHSKQGESIIAFGGEGVNDSDRIRLQSMVAKWANFEIEYGDSSDDPTPGGFFGALIDIGKNFWSEVRRKDSPTPPCARPVASPWPVEALPCYASSRASREMKAGAS